MVVSALMGRDPMNTAFVVVEPQKPKLGRALEKRQVHAKHQKPKRLKQTSERSCRAVAPSSEAASCNIKRRVAGYLLQPFTRTRSFIGMRRSNTKAGQHLANTTDATLREVRKVMHTPLNFPAWCIDRPLCQPSGCRGKRINESGELT
ncbi:hypothetical protein, unlikely [Trypanosoma congolense IL3000]|uniref:Uncharacterized protein n=1 Tax=Trypanosoma congolense (strain IL3000) TaxID=1068625 RepID=F9WDR1_TRYCI|nr:hypothetical protein, unlikely [Trypanosoma congolense IL3000]